MASGMTSGLLLIKDVFFNDHFGTYYAAMIYTHPLFIQS